MGGRYEPKPRRPLLGYDLRIGALLALGLALKFAPPMLSAKPKNYAVAPVLVAADPSRPPTDALTNTLPTSVRQATASADDPPVLSAPVFAFEEKKSSASKADPILPEPPKADPLDPPKPLAKTAGSTKKTDDAPSKPVKLRPPESFREDPPILLADAKKKTPDVKGDADKAAPKEAAHTAPKAVEKKGPVHPYFQRYLDQKEYYVRPGDTLERIAHRLYQDSAKAADLLAANKDALPNLDALKPGMTLKLP